MLENVAYTFAVGKDIPSSIAQDSHTIKTLAINLINPVSQSHSQGIDSFDSLPGIAEVEFVRVVDAALLGQDDGDYDHGGQVAGHHQPPRGHVRRREEFVDVAGWQINRIKNLPKN